METRFLKTFSDAVRRLMLEAYSLLSNSGAEEPSGLRHQRMQGVQLVGRRIAAEFLDGCQDRQAMVDLVKHGQRVAHGPLAKQPIQAFNVGLIQSGELLEQRRATARLLQVDKRLNSSGQHIGGHRGRRLHQLTGEGCDLRTAELRQLLEMFSYQRVF